MKIKYLKYLNQNLVKNLIRQDTWCSTHINCFKCSLSTKNTHFGNKILPESEKHIRAKFEKYLFWRNKGFDVLVEPRLKNGLRPDLICFNEFEIFIDEIAVSEKEASLIQKRKKYPFKVIVTKIE